MAAKRNTHPVTNSRNGYAVGGKSKPSSEKSGPSFDLAPYLCAAAIEFRKRAKALALIWTTL